MPEALDVDDLRGHAYVIGASLEYNEPIIYKKNGVVNIGKIGEVVDSYYDSPEIQGEQRTSDIEVVTFDRITYEVAWRPIQYVYRHRYDGKMLRFGLESGREVTVTPDHSLFVLKDGKITDVHSEEIKPGDFVVGTRRIPADATKNVSIDLAKIGYHSKADHLPLKLEIDEEFARLLGYYTAEGSATMRTHPPKQSYSLVFHFGPGDEIIIKDTVSILRKRFGAKVVVENEKGSKGVRVRTSNKMACQIISKLVGRGASNKVVPEAILNSPLAVRDAFYEAWVKGDCNTTISRDLANGVSYMLLMEGCIDTIFQRKLSKSMIGDRIVQSRHPIFSVSFPRAKEIKTGSWRRDRVGGNFRYPASQLPNPLVNVYKSTPTLQNLHSYINQRALDLMQRRLSSGLSTSYWSREEKKQMRKAARELEDVNRITKSSLTFFKVRTVTETKSSSSFVYDLSVDGNENFLAGFGGVLCKNTRSGKTNALLYTMDYLSNESVQKRLPTAVVFIDPHGEASFDLATRVKDIKKLFIFDPTYVSFGLNPLELPSYKTKEEKSFLIQTQVSELATILKDLFGSDVENSPRLVWIFRSCLYFLYATSDEAPTFADLYALLSDMIARDADELQDMLRSVGIEDELISKTIEAITKLESAAFTAVLNRISNFVMPPDSLTSRTFCVRKSTLPFEEMMKPGVVTIFRLSKFHLPNDFRVMITNTLLLKFYFMIQKRARDAERDGGPMVPNNLILTIDEFQNIGSLDTIDSVLSEAAKYGLYLIMAHQNTAQLREELFETIMGNVGLVMSFRVGPDDAHKLAKLMDPSKGKEIETILPRLPNWVCLVRKNPVGGRGLSNVMRIQFPKVHEPVRTVNEVTDHMKNVMNPAYGNAVQDLKPIYKDKLEELRRAEGMPLVSPLQWGIMTKLFVQHEVTHTEMVHQLYNENYWDGSVVQGGLTNLQQLGYISGMVTTDPDKRGGGWNILQKQNRGEMPIMKPGPKSQDEMDRSREIIYHLSEDAKNKFFRTLPHGRRGGGKLHQLMMNVLLNEYWQGGSWVTVDTGDQAGEKADLLVFSPKEKIERNKRAVDPLNWDKSPFAVEIETYPEKSQQQVRHNLEKNAKKGYKKIMFVVSSPEHRVQVDKILRDMGYQYELKTLNIYEDPETYKKYLSEEMKYFGEEGGAEYSEAATWKPPEKVVVQGPPKRTEALDAIEAVISAVTMAVEAGDIQTALREMMKAADILGPLDVDDTPEAQAVRARWKEFGASKVYMTPALRDALIHKQPEKHEPAIEPPTPIQTNKIEPDKTQSDIIAPESPNGVQNAPLLNNGAVLSPEELARQTEEKDKAFRIEILQQLARTPNVPMYKLSKMLSTSEKRLVKHLQYLESKGSVVQSGGVWRLAERATS
ncbi:MAG: TraM recognition domain-containing protein [Nitrososphaerota archaeon]|nr:TraM recognition domain-containing protein [Nitrososphaerota archaeon]